MNALSGMPLKELAELLAPLPRYRAEQIFKWIASGAASFGEMSNLPLPLREELSGRFLLRPDVSAERRQGGDGTVKLILEFSDGAAIESVLLSDSSERHTKPSDIRRTVCISTQAGCPAGCVFCKTGTKFSRNLESAEIVEQFLQLRAQSPIDNIVVMGMGEPLLNLAELRKALAVISGKEGINFSRRRITVSTCGILQGITELTERKPAVRLALSLTTGDEDLRRRLMPITKSHPLGEVKKALSLFQQRYGERITLEAVLLGGINTREKDAAGIASFADGLDTVINLIPWNPVKGLEFEGKALREPSIAEVESFERRLEALGLNVTRRFRRGRGVSGACGQLGE